LEKSGTGLTVYPNPVDDYISVFYDNYLPSDKKGISIEIINLNGQTIFQDVFSSGTTQF